MTSPRITFTYSVPEPPALDLLQIEQSDWSEYTGLVTKNGMVLTIRELLYGEESGDVVDCGMENGDVLCLIDVYPRVPGLVYQFDASYGDLSSRREEIVQITESINFSLTDSVTPQHPPIAITGARWLDEVYDVNGDNLERPELTIVEGNIVVPFPVYGSVEATYTTERHSYTLTLPRREEALDNFYTAAVYGWYQGGVDWLEIELPPGIEIFENDPDAICGGGSGTVNDPDDPRYEQPVAANRLTIVDYCTQEVLEEEFW